MITEKTIKKAYELLEAQWIFKDIMEKFDLMLSQVIARLILLEKKILNPGKCLR